MSLAPPTHIYLSFILSLYPASPNTYNNLKIWSWLGHRENLSTFQESEITVAMLTDHD